MQILLDGRLVIGAEQRVEQLAVLQHQHQRQWPAELMIGLLVGGVPEIQVGMRLRWIRDNQVGWQVPTIRLLKAPVRSSLEHLCNSKRRHQIRMRLVKWILAIRGLIQAYLRVELNPS